jgi:hypothetical protein
MSGGSGGPIILKNIKAALSVSANPSGSVKLWHALLLTHVLAFLAGALVF